MKIGFTGTRNGLTDRQVVRLADWLAPHKGAEFHQGCCVGADSHAADIADELGLRVVGRPSNIRAMTCDAAVRVCAWTAPPCPPLQRNRDIVNFTDLLVACPAGPEVQRSGTWSTVRHARRLGRHIVIVWSDGSVTEENQTSQEV